MKRQLNEVRKFQKIAGLIKENYDETNLDTIISDIQSHIQTSSAIGDPDFKVSALNVIKSIDDNIKYENWEEVLLDLEDLQSELEQKNPTEYEQVFSEMFEKAIRRVETLAIENEHDDDDNEELEEDEENAMIDDNPMDDIPSVKLGIDDDGNMTIQLSAFFHSKDNGKIALLKDNPALQDVVMKAIQIRSQKAFREAVHGVLGIPYGLK